MHSMASGHFEFESEGFRAKRHRDRAHCFRGSEIHGKIGVAGGIGRNLAAAGTANSSHTGRQASSAGSTAVPFAERLTSAIAFSRALASTPFKNSWCSRWAFVITTTVGRIQLINCAISPGWLIPGLNHRRLRARCEFQKHAGYAHGVIEVAFRGKHRLFAAGLPQN